MEKANFKENYFDVITLFSVLEHILDPFEVLKEVSRILKKDGLLVIRVPVIPFYLSVVRSKWRNFIGDHYFFFTDKSMSQMLNQTGFMLNQKKYFSKSVDLDLITDRLSDAWFPNSLGQFGNLLRKFVLFLGIHRIRFPINLFDTKVYLAKPIK